MKKLFALLLASTALSYAITPEPDVVTTHTVTYSTPPNSGYFLCDGTADNVVTPGVHEFSFVITNSVKAISGVSINGTSIMGSGPWSVNITSDTSIAALISNAKPNNYFVPDGILPVAISCSSSWQKIIFGSPKSVKFVDDGKTYLYPATPSSVLIQAVGGDISISTSTNAYEIVATAGDPAVVPVGALTISSGSSVVFGKQVSRLFFKGSGKINIVGISQ